VALKTCAVVGVVLIVCHVLSPRKYVVLSAVPVASRAVGTVPLVKLLAFKLDKSAEVAIVPVLSGSVSVWLLLLLGEAMVNWPVPLALPWIFT
jgi:hypothetical protein